MPPESPTTDAEGPASLSRRRMLLHSAAWLGTAMTVAQWESIARAAAPEPPEAGTLFLDRRRFTTLGAAVDVLLPAGETPGALDAGVDRLIDRLLAEWAAPERRERWQAGLDGFDRLAQADGAHGFAEGTRRQQSDLLQRLDDAAYADGGSGGFYPEFKKVALFAYFTSEAGATQSLRYERLPGEYRPCLPYTAGDGAWFWNGYAYEL
ncbi:MAG TPA: gluconate 2-dehydrogenase subunit 3 family protein [Woeseiaceae bacterium]|nr:gluconate 2-dehydrogenase subunit 3 family protein [Woeseiaceae bacterium]